MSTVLRVLLVIGSVLVFMMIGSRIKKDKILMQDAIYWVILSLLMLLVALVPGPVIWLAYELGFLSPSNFVFLGVIALLLLKIFHNSCEISLLRHKVEELAQEGVLSDGLERAEQEEQPNG